MITKAFTMSLAFLVALACSEERAPITAEPGSGGSGGSGGGGAALTGGGPSADASSGDATATGGKGGTACPADAKGAKMVLVTTSSGPRYCIDEREVSQGEYLAFASDKGSDLSGQPAECADNKSYVPALPDPYIGAPQPGTCHKDYWQGNPDRPMVCVDFCDAAAYCKWAGKRLCTSLDAQSDAVLKVKDAELEALAKDNRLEWTDACTQGGKTAWPYGDAYVPGTCIDKTRYDAQGPSALDATKLEGETCHGATEPYSSIFHMSGSVAEWVNGCDEGMGYCLVLGGSISSASEPCQLPAMTFRTSTAPWHGIRCCADLE